MKGLAREFSRMGPHDRITIATIRLRAKLHARNVVRKLDESVFADFTDVFFGFEILEERLDSGLSEDSPGEYQLVMAYHPKQVKFEQLFLSIPKCVLVGVKISSPAALYLALSGASFRVEAGMLFQRLVLEPVELLKACNPLARMLFVEQDILCLSSLKDEEAVLPKLHQYFQAYHSTPANNHSARKKQRALQKYLYGQYNQSTQIHLPQSEREPIFQMLEVETVPSEMRDESSEMLQEDGETQLGRMLQGLNL